MDAQWIIAVDGYFFENVVLSLSVDFHEQFKLFVVGQVHSGE